MKSGPVLALSHIGLKIDDEVSIREMHGVWYKWKFVQEKEMENDNLKDAVVQTSGSAFWFHKNAVESYAKKENVRGYDILPVGCKYLLLLNFAKTEKQKEDWKPWLSLRNSQYAYGNVGVEL